MSHELPFLVRFFVRLSKKINAYSKLPLEAEAPMKTWQQVLELRFPKTASDAFQLLTSNFSRFKRSYRFNLRFLANVRIASVLASITTTFLYALGVFSIYFFALFFLLCGFLYLDGTNTWLPRPNSIA